MKWRKAAAMESWSKTFVSAVARVPFGLNLVLCIAGPANHPRAVIGHQRTPAIWQAMIDIGDLGVKIQDTCSIFWASTYGTTFVAWTAPTWGSADTFGQKQAAVSHGWIAKSTHGRMCKRRLWIHWTIERFPRGSQCAALRWIGSFFCFPLSVSPQPLRPYGSGAYPVARLVSPLLGLKSMLLDHWGWLVSSAAEWFGVALVLQPLLGTCGLEG